MSNTTHPREQAELALAAWRAAIKAADPKAAAGLDAGCAYYYDHATAEYQLAAAEATANHLWASYAHGISGDAWFHAGELCEQGALPGH